MRKIKIGIIGGGYMGKRHAVAFSAVGATFGTKLRPILEMVCARSMETANSYKESYGFARATDDWRVLTNDPDVDAVIIASPQSTHEEIALAAFSAGKHVLCEKPLSVSVNSSRRMADAAVGSGKIHMAGFNYVRTPATQFARQMIARGDLGQITHFRGEHTEDFLANPGEPANWRTSGQANGTMNDLAPHMINAALALLGPIDEVIADVETVHSSRPFQGGGMVDVTNDDQGQMMVRFGSGVMGHLHFSRIATGRKMGYAYEVTGTEGALRFDQEDQNALWFYDRSGPEELRGFRKILTGPTHPDYAAFCDGPGHGTGYNDQITIQAHDFLKAIEEGRPVWPTFNDGLAVDCIIEAAHESSKRRSWVTVLG
jgi:predicted dehydrogenase